MVDESKSERERREERLAAELRANLKKRKVQLRAREQDSADEPSAPPFVQGREP